MGMTTTTIVGRPSGSTSSSFATPGVAASPRAIAIVGLLPLFVGAGMIMLPTVLFGGLAAIRTDWPRGVRWGFAGFAAIRVAFVAWGEVWSEFGVSPRAVAGIAGPVAIYGVVVWATRFGLAT